MFDKAANYKQSGHFTAVAGIAVADNPEVRLMMCTYVIQGLYNDLAALDTNSIIQKIQKSAKEIISMVKYFKEHNVRAVNMSWSVSTRYIGSLLQQGKPEILC